MADAHAGEGKPPKKTPLYEAHLEAGAKMVEFGGWLMPVRYGSDIEEHKAVRNAAGLFDVSHMGEIRVRGEGALAFLQRVTPNDVSKLEAGRCHYSGLLTPQATYVDDLLIYHLGPDDYLVVVNASNIEKDFAWLDDQPHPGCEIEDQSERFALLAIQGPKAKEILARHTAADLDAIRYYGFVQDQEVAGAPCLISRTGYTGEDGFELYLPPEDAPRVWRALLAGGADLGVRPAGLGARDTLRLEAGMALYGHEIDAGTTPYEANLGWVVKLSKGDFLGREVLLAQKEKGPPRKLVGFEMVGKGIGRQGYKVFWQGAEAGEVRSGSFAPTLEKAIGTAYVPAAAAAPGTPLEIEIRQKKIEAVVVPMPFYKRPA
jgi:aminomethyltransferase